ncbi:hypothetical protein DICSQDRAFT_65323 [Dichomitus squalens LYAD-421 SS1]|uniref:Uncharacterized protein n=1 Tax=Dichomitus squalens (strain LYAD-421) TaxID=732165 RepID=R7SSU1_DICSQ|nr:uncharacterized protein DICSQDRAFT_65323 [Dichomitus squalens LYAD-421 SS1]EJF59254.1 hypothetical protein DICSQDRAFT_65323 [Dichomitus squalens LYAD-421 SS1]
MSTSAYRNYGSRVHGSQENMYAPFVSETDWDVGRWANLHGISSAALTELLTIKGLVEKLGLSFRNANQLHDIFDNSLPSRRPSFKYHEAHVMGEAFEMYARDIMECIEALYGDPEHVHYLCFAPERHYADADHKVRLYHDMHTGQWWWSIQETLEEQNPGATVIPVIISSDKTQLTLFRNKTAYPVYLTIGNLPKSIRQKPGRQGQILLAYLPTSRLEHITNKAARRRVLANLFHACMSKLLEPLKAAGVHGTVMVSGDGVARRCHPILAAYVGDYPEQCLVACAYNGDCPICTCPHDELGDFPSSHPPRDMKVSLAAVKSLESPTFVQACDNANIKPVQHPFWEDLPYTDIFRSITADVLHQVYQGVFKHLLSWLKVACGAAEIDARVRCLPFNHSIRKFYKGITGLSRVTGTEHRQISRFLLSIVVDMDLPREHADRLVCVTRSLLRFAFLAQYPVHDDTTLKALEKCLFEFHQSRDLYGTTDNYNTETSERLHIDFTKDAYRATNHRDEYPQMTRWLERREKVLHHDNYISWRSQQAAIGPATLSAQHNQRWQPPDLACSLHVKMTQHPTRRAVSLHELLSPDGYCAKHIGAAICRFVVQFRHPTLTSHQLENRISETLIPFTHLAVYHRIKFWNEQVFGQETCDSIHVHPRQVNERALKDTVVPARFDTALILPGHFDSAFRTDAYVIDLRVGQIRVVFTLPDAALDYYFPGIPPEQRPPRHLAYVEWFSKFPASPEKNSGFYKVSRSSKDGERLVSVVPVGLIQRSIHLTPKWNGPVPSDWSSENVLEKCTVFYVNTDKDMHTFFNVY